MKEIIKYISAGILTGISLGMIFAIFCNPTAFLFSAFGVYTCLVIWIVKITIVDVLFYLWNERKKHKK